MQYAGFLQRLVAYAIDSVVLIGIYCIIGLLLGMSLIFPSLMALPMVGFWFYGGLFFTAWLYFAIFESSTRSATLGKQLLGLKVVDLEGQRIGFWRATARYFSRLILRIGALLIFFTKKKQALHDKIARVVVIQKST